MDNWIGVALLVLIDVAIFIMILRGRGPSLPKVQLLYTLKQRTSCLYC